MSKMIPANSTSRKRFTRILKPRRRLSTTSISGGAPLDPSDYDLHAWYLTAEGRSFASAVADLAWPWDHSAVNGLEDFAWTCAFWYIQPAHLQSVSPERYAWAQLHLP